MLGPSLEVQTTDPVPPSTDEKASWGSGPAQCHGRGPSLWRNVHLILKDLGCAHPEVLAQGSRLPPGASRQGRSHPSRGVTSLDPGKEGPCSPVWQSGARAMPGSQGLRFPRTTFLHLLQETAGTQFVRTCSQRPELSRGSQGA